MNTRVAEVRHTFYLCHQVSNREKPIPAMIEKLPLSSLCHYTGQQCVTPPSTPAAPVTPPSTPAAPVTPPSTTTAAPVTPPSTPTRTRSSFNPSSLHKKGLIHALTNSISTTAVGGASKERAGPEDKQQLPWQQLVGECVERQVAARTREQTAALLVQTHLNTF